MTFEQALLTFGALFRAEVPRIIFSASSTKEQNQAFEDTFDVHM